MGKTTSKQTDAWVADARARGLDVSVGSVAPIATARPTAKAPDRTLPAIALIQALWVAAWHPATLNRIMSGHWSTGARLKKDDAAIVRHYFDRSGITPAAGPRGVDLHVVLPKGRRAPDRDAYWKSLLDALVHARALVDDTPRLCNPGRVTFSRTTEEIGWGTMILLTDLQ